jgi:hypothetical protein
MGLTEPRQEAAIPKMTEGHIEAYTGLQWYEARKPHMTWRCSGIQQRAGADVGMRHTWVWDRYTRWYVYPRRPDPTPTPSRSLSVIVSHWRVRKLVRRQSFVTDHPGFRHILVRKPGISSHRGFGSKSAKI